MSSTYVHYSTPSSLPSDYAILSRYASARPDDDNASVVDTITDDGSDAFLRVPDAHGGMANRRSSFPTQYIRPLNPTIASLPIPPATQKLWTGSKAVIPSESTPLLGPLVPRIAEEVDSDDDDDGGAAARARRVTMFWEEARILSKYTHPVFGSHLLEYSLVIASVISLGHLSTAALAASTLGSMTASVTGFSVIQGFCSTLDTMLPSAWTSPEPKLVGLWSQRMAVVMSAVLIPIIAIWLNAEAILLGLKQDPEVAGLAALYLKCLSFGLPAYAFNTISRRYFQSQGLFAVPTHVILAIAPVNALLNYLFVWGPPPIRLGFIGAPLATAISFNLISICYLFYGIFFVPRTAWHPLSIRCFTSLGVLVQLGLAGVGQTASEWWSWELVGLAASFLGPVTLASQSVLLVSASTTYQAPFALSVATSVRIGNLLGEQNAQRAGVTAQTSMLMALVIAGICSTILIVFRNQWALIFNNDPDVVALVASILPLVALFQVFDGLCACTGGILRARGKQFTGALLNLSAYYIIGIPFGIWLTFSRGMGLAGLWIGLTVSLVYASTIGIAISLQTDWKREVGKVLARLAADRLARTDGEA